MFFQGAGASRRCDAMLRDFAEKAVLRAFLAEEARRASERGETAAEPEVPIFRDTAGEATSDDECPIFWPIDDDRIVCPGGESSESEGDVSLLPPLEAGIPFIDEGGERSILVDEDAPSFCTGARGWRPGFDCRGWVDNEHPMEPQGQALVTNVVVSFGKLTKPALNALAVALRGSWAKVRSSGVSAVVACAAWALGLSTERVKNVYAAVTENPSHWSPAGAGETAAETSAAEPRAGEAAAEKRAAEPRAGEAAADLKRGAELRAGKAAADLKRGYELRAGKAAARRDTAIKQLRHHVRLALATAYEGRSHWAYERDATRMALAHASLNSGSWWRSFNFCKMAASLGVLVVQQLDAHDFNEVLPGLGIPSDAAAVADPVTIGMSVLARHDTVLVMCLALVSARTGSVYNPMLSGDPMPVGAHGGEAMVQMWLDAFANHPASWGLSVLRARLAAVGGDGGVCEGGVDSRHMSSAAAEKLWLILFPESAAAYAATVRERRRRRGRRGRGAGGDRPVGSLPPRRGAGGDRPHGHVEGGGSVGEQAETAPICTSWDPFHRVDNCVWRAVRRVEEVLAVFDIAKEIDYLFGMSEGVAIFRGVAKMLDDTGVRKIKAPGGTRKVVYLAGVPGHLLVNFFALYTALWARVAWKQAGHSSQKLRHILDLASRLAAPSNVVVMLMLQDVFGRVIQPLARQVQQHIEPSQLAQTQRTALAKIATMRPLLRKLRALVRVISLLRQHAGPQDLRNMLDAFAIGSVKSMFPTFFAYAGDILGPQRSFNGVSLTVADAHDPSQENFLGAHCQCPAVVARAERDLASAQARPPQAGPRSRSRRDRAAAADAPSRKVSFRVDEKMDWVCTPPRCQVYATAPRFPAGLHTLDMFRHGITDRRRGAPCAPACVNTRRGRQCWQGVCPCQWSSACLVSRQAHLVDCAFDDGLAAIAAFLEAVDEELSAIFGSVGSNETMTRLLTNASRCWDWPRLVFEIPCQDDLHAFQSICATLRPCFAQTLYPVDTAFAHVERQWPTLEERAAQYMQLCRRVRAAAAAAGRAAQRHSSGRAGSETAVRSLGVNVPRGVCDAAAGWMSGVSAYVVLPLWVHPPVHGALRQAFRGRGFSDRFVILRIASTVSRFLGTFGAATLPAEAYETIRASESELGAATARRLRVKVTVSVPEWSPNAVARLRAAPGRPTPVALVGRAGRSGLVEVLLTKRRVDVRLVSASLDLYPWFAIGTPPHGRVAWWPSRVHHRCRLLFPPDPCCEAVGSVMRLQWDQRRSALSPEEFMGNVFLAQSRVACVGGVRDEMIVDFVAREIQRTSAWLRCRSTEERVPAKVRAIEESLVASGRAHAGKTAEWADEWLRPELLSGVSTSNQRRVVLAERSRRFLRLGLPEVVRDAVRRATRGGPVKNIPETVEQLHAKQKGKPNSTVRKLAKKQAWLKTDSGQAWQRERGKLMQADDPDESSSDEDKADAATAARSSGPQADPHPSESQARPSQPRKRGSGRRPPAAKRRKDRP